MKLLQISSIAYLLIIWTKGVESEVCTSPQYMKSGSLGIIQCSFQEDVFSVIWYNSTDVFSVDAILTIRKSTKIGVGFDTGEFDVYPNGSLIINNVSIKHEGTYRVIKLDTPTSRAMTYTIRVLVIAPTFVRLPIIGKCDNGSGICFQRSDQNSEISCTVRDARPAISLSWLARSVDGDRNVSSHLVITNESHPYFTSRVTTTNPFNYSVMFALLVCKADGPSGLLEKNESLVLLQNSGETLKNVKSKQTFVEKHSRVQLPCTDNQISYLVWQVNQSLEVDFKTILYAVLVGDNFTHINDEDYKLHANSLVVDKVGVYHEGTYRCISGNGFEEDQITYDVVVYVPPDPAYLIVDGCDHQQYCVQEAYLEGSLTCTVKRVWPQVDLEFKEVFSRSLNNLHFYDKKITIKDNGDTYDVVLTSKYRFDGAAKSRLTVECKVLGTNVGELHFSTKFDLLFLQGFETNSQENMPSEEYNYWIIAFVLVFVLVFLLACGLFIVFKVHCRRGQTMRQTSSEKRMETDTTTNFSDGDKNKGRGNTDQKETIPMMSRIDLQGKKEIFLSELKVKYRDLYDAVQPIPYIKDRLYCVDRVFVEGGIEYLVALGNIEGHGTWEKLSSYHNILDDVRVKSTRRIIEGEPGYGKSTIALQLSYDWCNKIQISYLKDIHVLICLRLRQLGGVSSIYRAIKQFILPKDSKLSEIDVENIIGDCTSVLVILDGYDEYPDQDSGIDSNVIDIIMNNMFQQFEVILTTRSSYLPKKCPALTKRLRLTGFDGNARDQYIRKAVVGDDVEAAEKIKQRLLENPILGDLCQVPLIFVMFAHMSHESKQFQKFHSVTSFFVHMISCFHSHMKNKMEDENVTRYDLFETNHRELDKLAFEGLSGKDQKIVWNKKYIRKRLGNDFYDLYLRIGIFVEEEVLDINNDLRSTITGDTPYRIDVTFYHKLFCEWYAAHHLAEYASKEDVNFKPWIEQQNTTQGRNDHYLTNVDPFDLQYVYRFACGLNPVAAEKIIGYLKTRKDASKFAILCILEKHGKVEDILKDVENLCAKDVNIHDDDSLLFQRSTIQILEIALANKISISWVWLYASYSTVDMSGANYLQLKSTLSIPVLPTLNKLMIHEPGRELTSEEFTCFLQYSSKCLALKELRFFNCLLPQFVQPESVSVLQSRKVKAYWGPHRFYCDYCLNFDSGLWENVQGASVLTDDDYLNLVTKFRKAYPAE